MTTLAVLKAQIADDIARPDLTSQISAAIVQAIDFYKEERLFFTDTRDETFATVADQSTYDVDDDAAIPLFIKVDAMFIEDSDGISYGPLDRLDQKVMERLLDSSAATGRPESWSYFNQQFFFHPIPDDAYTVRPIGQIEVVAPDTDIVTGNLWMTRGFELIRCAVKANLYVHTIKEDGPAAVFAISAERQLGMLRRDTSKRTSTGRIVPTSF
jgi:hypothetical protein